MSRNGQRPDTKHVLAGLKDFQRRTVDYVFRRLYLDHDYTRRFLIADEVGLGKTLVAKGVVARAVDHLWDRVGRIDVIYICSNADIARQNIARLNIIGDRAFSLPKRITLLPKYVQGLERNRLNFVAFTPGTSFHLKSSTGITEERALLYRLLKKPWRLRGKAPKFVLRVGASYKVFDNWCEWSVSPEMKVDRKIERTFLRELSVRIADDKERGEPDLRTRFGNLCSAFNRVNARVSQEDHSERAGVIGELRGLLASVCLEALEPDLIILDEFQRFKHLLKAEDDAGILAQNLFRFADEKEHSEARVLLLSATPYKMYSMDHEIAEDDHYADFLRTLGFLLEDPLAEADFKQALQAYSAGFFQHGGVDTTAIRALKADLEVRLRRVMVRTEKLTATANRDGMLQQVTPPSLALVPRDLHGFVKLQAVAELLDHSSVMEYWKSGPYLLNFMDDYALKRRFEKEADRRGTSELQLLLRDRKDLLLNWRDVSRYRAIEPANAKLRSLLADTVGRGMWRLLWIPPSLPYHGLRGSFSEDECRGITKRLVFSCWKVVPKVIAALTSYDAERKTILSLDPKASNTVQARKTRRPLLRFTFSDDRLTGMPVLGMIYPALQLAELCDPLAIRRHLGGKTEPSLDRVLEEATRRVSEAICGLKVKEDTSGPVDEKWYWAAPVLLDMAAQPKQTMAWFAQEELTDQWRQYTRRSSDDDQDGRWGDHVDEMRRLAVERSAGFVMLGRRPDDLPQVLAKLGVGGFGCCALRALGRLDGHPSRMDIEERNESGALAHAFLSFFNVPEAMAVVRGRDAREPYWLRVAEYCCDGCLQAVLDEYVHVLRESMGLMDAPPDAAAQELAEVIAGALTMRTSRVGVDNVHVSTHENGIAVSPRNMRIRFALRFGSDYAEDGGEVTREDQVRAGFNSPFWPFVVATTSIGQEGLDFHQYCHAVVHWNLPSNPVDLEQREGRVHRYKGHAVRKNLAREFSHVVWDGGDSEPWAAMFEAALQARPPDVSDIYPFWVLPCDGGAHIERHILDLPLSREENRLHDLRRSLAAYRVVFGQPRQEDMLAYLLEHVPEADLEQMVADLRIDLEPREPEDVAP